MTTTATHQPVPVAQDGIVVRLDKARLLLVEARDATDAKKVADLAHAEAEARGRPAEGAKARPGATGAAADRRPVLHRELARRGIRARPRDLVLTTGAPPRAPATPRTTADARDAASAYDCVWGSAAPPGPPPGLTCAAPRGCKR
jgi:hypothetical protein